MFLQLYDLYRYLLKQVCRKLFLLYFSGRLAIYIQAKTDISKLFELA
ncbi:MAG: hypothetical protein IK065_03710 [Neisseriaceae bacterium]|nr:hypothetical protein [Neisseriaceae bacterium]